MVMTQRDKIGMEALFRRVLPPHKRLGSQFVFRQARVHTISTVSLLGNIPCRQCAARLVNGPRSIPSLAAQHSTKPACSTMS